jgi:hypothetical protein
MNATPISALSARSIHSTTSASTPPSALRRSAGNSLNRSAPSASTPGTPANANSSRSLSLASRLRLPILRKHASDSPEDVQKQVKLFNELITADAAGKDELIARFEELTSVGGNNGIIHPLLKNDEAFKLYLRYVDQTSSYQDID